MKKICIRCKQEKDVSLFGSAGQRCYCKKCVNEYQKKWRKNHPDLVHKYRRIVWLRAGYGITPQDYEDMLKKQGNACAICGKPPSTNGGRTRIYLYIDHSHKTKKIRGLLCSNCNRGLGYFFDNPALLKNAEKYLIMHEEERVKNEKV